MAIIDVKEIKEIEDTAPMTEKKSSGMMEEKKVSGY